MSKKPIAWVVDSTVFISEKIRQHPDVHIVPMNIFFGDEQYKDGVDLTPDQLYEKIRNAEVFPKTSQPSAGEFAEIFTTLSEQYETAIAIHVTAKLSGTLATSMAGAKIANFDIKFIDSLSLSVGITGLIERGLELQANGLSVDKIVESLELTKTSLQNWILVGQLNQLYKGGRMNGVQFFLGSLLQIKPIIQINKEGELFAADKVRSEEKKALQYLVDKTLTSYEQFGMKTVHIMHGHNLKQAEQLKEILLAKAPKLEVVIGDISSVLAVHAGEGTVAVFYYES